jgi:hypothetical protein
MNGSAVFNRHDKAANGLADAAKGKMFAILPGSKPCHRDARQGPIPSIAYNHDRQKRIPIRRHDS